MPLKVVAEIIDGVFRERYVGGPSDDRFGYAVGNDLSDTLYELTEADDDRLVDALIEALEGLDSYWPGDGEEPFYSVEYSYTPNDNSFNSHSLLWRSFRSTLLYDQRFFNAKARTRIGELFEDIHRQRDADGQPAVYLIKPGDEGSRYFRARTADEPDLRRKIKAATARELGPPPRAGRKPGRLNPSGILAFYGAATVETCVAELRPPVGGVICAAQFELTAPICVLDTTRFASPGKNHDPFSRGAVARTAQWRFMRSFMDEISKPVRPSDEHREYIPTQAVADFLSNELTFYLNGVKRRIDAIIYGSAQAGADARNIVLLGDAALVEGGHNAGEDDYIDFDAYDPEEASWRFWDVVPEPRLRLVPDSLALHRVAAAGFTVKEYSPFDGLALQVEARDDADDDGDDGFDDL